MRANQVAKELARRRAVVERNRKFDRVLRAEIVASVLAAKLMLSPDDDALAASLHELLDHLHEAQTKF
jgi:hypothetical protein